MSTTTTSPATSAERETAREAGLTVSGIQPYEFLFPGSTVTVETTAPLDPDAAKRTIGVPRASNVVKVGPKGRKATWQPPEDLEPGRHVLQIGPLLSAEGAELAPQVAIPFQFARSAGRVPDGIAVEGMTRIRMSGNAIEALSSERAAPRQVRRAPEGRRPPHAGAGRARLQRDRQARGRAAALRRLREAPGQAPRQAPPAPAGAALGRRRQPAASRGRLGARARRCPSRATSAASSRSTASRASPITSSAAPRRCEPAPARSPAS